MTIRILVTAAVMALAGCAALAPGDAPTPRTEYRFAAPDSPEGQRCVSACDQRNAHCRGLADGDSSAGHQRCEQQAQDEYDNCTMRTTSFSEKRQCYRKSCPVAPDYDRCDAAYRECYVACGGQVSSRPVCEGPC